MTSHGGNTLWVLCMAQITTILVVYSPEIEKAMRRGVKPYHFLIRTSAFILLHALGYGVVTIFGAGILAQLYKVVPSPWTPFIMLGVFLGIGLLAQQHKHI